MRTEKIANVAIGALGTALILAFTSWSWKVGVVFFVSYVALYLLPFSRFITLGLYCIGWGYFWSNYFIAIYQTVTARSDIVMLILNLVPTSIFVLIFLAIMAAGFPVYLFDYVIAAPYGENVKDIEATLPISQSDQTRPGKSALCRILGIPTNASISEIETGYRKQMALYHPDKVAHLGVELQRIAEKRTVEIHNAYEVLTNL